MCSEQVKVRGHPVEPWSRMMRVNSDHDNPFRLCGSPKLLGPGVWWETGLPTCEGRRWQTLLFGHFWKGFPEAGGAEGQGQVGSSPSPNCFDGALVYTSKQGPIVRQAWPLTDRRAFSLLSLFSISLVSAFVLILGFTLLTLPLLKVNRRLFISDLSSLQYKKLK